MSCTACGTSHSPQDCDYESRLSIGVKDDQSAIVGSLDRKSFKPILLKRPVQANETVTTLKYDTDKRALVYSGESVSRPGGSPDYIESREILSGATVAQLGDVGALVAGGVATVAVIDGEPRLVFSVPEPIELGEISGGFLTYVTNPNDGSSYLKTIRPDTNGTSDTVLLGKPDGSVEFSGPIVSPLVVPANTLTSAGQFNGAPSSASGTWRYQVMGTSQIVTNNSGSAVEVELNFRYSLVTTGTHSGVYCSLNNGGADYKTAFIDGSANAKQEGYPGGYASFTVKLETNQKCQFVFGAWTNAAGNMEATIGSINESGGSTTKTVYPPTIRIRRLV